MQRRAKSNQALEANKELDVTSGRALLRARIIPHAEIVSDFMRHLRGHSNIGIESIAN